MQEDYFSILVFLVIGIFVGLVPLTISAWLSPKKKVIAKEKPYECGFDSFGKARSQFDIRFYLVAILFIIFSVEMAFLFSWAVVMRELGWQALFGMIFFLGLLFVGLIYEWKKGFLNWRSAWK